MGTENIGRNYAKCFYGSIRFTGRPLRQSFQCPVTGLRALTLIALCLLPFLTAACLTTRSSKAPAFRGLTASEAGRLASENSTEWRKTDLPRAEKDDPSENPAEMAEIFLQNGDYERSVYHYSKILSRNPEQYDIRYKLGLAMLLAGNLEESKKELAEVLLHKNDMVEAHEALGLAFLQENKIMEAQREFHSALALDSRRYQAHYLLGMTLMRQKQFPQALQEFKTALAAVPDSPRIMSAIGWACYQQKNYDQGLQWLQKAKAIHPGNPEINRRLAMILAAQKKYPEALQAFRQAGDEAQAFNNIGVYYYLDHRYAEAARFFQKALQLRPVFYQEAKVNLEKALTHIQDENSGMSDQTDREPKELSLMKNPLIETQEN